MATKKTKTEEHDFNALDRLAKSVTPDQLRALTPAQKTLRSLDAEWDYLA
jgi:hypothetical protein